MNLRKAAAATLVVAGVLLLMLAMLWLVLSQYGVYLLIAVMAIAVITILVLIWIAVYNNL